MSFAQRYARSSIHRLRHGGYEAGPSQIAVKLAGRLTAAPGATVFCSGTRTSHDLAVFANGVMIRFSTSTTDI